MKTETRTKHTPGPWKANGLRSDPDPRFRLARAVWHEDGERPICFTGSTPGRYLDLSPEEQDANARLIASTPELLAFVESVVGFDGGITDENLANTWILVATTAKGLLAKATEGR